MHTLRKRTSFKPNLKQVASQQAVTTAPSTTDPNVESRGAIGPHGESPAASVIAAANHQENPSSLDYIPTTRSIGDDAFKASIAPPECRKEPESSNISRPTADITETSEKRVQDAINQLTSQKFEPIKSLSLRSSANKNVKLKDLLFFNPPMTKDQKRHKKSVALAKKRRLEEDQARSSQGSSVDGGDESGASKNKESGPASEEQPSLMPKVKMGPDGKLVLDESSTIINRKNSIKEQEAIIEDTEEIICKTNYDSYRRKATTTTQTKWSNDDTTKFYHALRILGTDFSLMESLLFSGTRSRTELHKKFKREERINKCKVDIALSSRLNLSSDELDDVKELLYK